MSLMKYKQETFRFRIRVRPRRTSENYHLRLIKILLTCFILRRL